MIEKLGRLCFILAIMLILSALLLLMSGCGSVTTITELDPVTGKPIKITETKLDPTELIIQSTQNKTVLVSREMYSVGLDLSPANLTIESILSLNMLYLHKKLGIASIHQAHQGNWAQIPLIFDSMQKTSSIGISASGVSSGTSSP